MSSRVGLDTDDIRQIERDYGRAYREEERQEEQSWHEELYEPPLSFPITAEHAYSLANLGQAHHAAHQANADATSEAFAAHVAKYEKLAQQPRSYAAELGEALEKHAR